MRFLYIDCPSGVSGDMLLGGLIDLGVDIDLLQEKLETLGLSGWRIEVEDRRVHGLVCKDVTVHSDETQPHRGLSDITTIITSSGLTDGEKNRALAIFKRLAAAEAKVHGMSVEEIHFHEVGAVDAIVDICGVSVALCILGIEHIECSPLPMGSGFVECMHGRIPIPAPATVELVKGLPVYDNGVEGELVTPTGAAIVSTLARRFGRFPAMTLQSVGYGCGKRQLPIPNAVRLFLGELDEQHSPTDRVAVIQANIDDMTGEQLGHVFERLLDMGALDVWYTPIQMKKGRPGVILSLMCEPSKCHEMTGHVLRETSSFGLRYRLEDRYILERDTRVIETLYGEMRVKLGFLNGDIIKASPEYEDCNKAARALGVPISQVMAAVTAHATIRESGEA